MSSRIMVEACSDCGSTGKQFGARGLCSACYRRTRRHTDSDFAASERARSQRWKDENREANRERDRQRCRDLRDPCPSCGELKDHKAARCVSCRDAAEAQHRALAEQLWAEGRSCREIGEALGYSGPFQSGPYRKHGWNLPYRYAACELKVAA